MNEIRRSELEINAETFHDCIVRANTNIEASLRAMGDKGEALNGVSDDGEFGDYKFIDVTTFLNSYLICRQNTDPHTKTVGLGHRNGFELYRLVCQLVDRSRGTRHSTLEASSSTSPSSTAGSSPTYVPCMDLGCS